MKGIEFDPVTGRIRIVNGERIVATTEGTLVCLLPELQEFSAELEYPNGTGGWVYGWRTTNDWNGLAEQYGQSNACKVWFTRLPQEHEESIVLAPAPAGADFFIGHVRVNRTVSPTHQWYGKDLNPLQKTGEWLPWNGSGLIEASFGLVRLLHLAIEGGNLVLSAQQSIGAYCGGTSRSWGSTPIQADGNAGTFENSGAPGVVVWSGASPYTKSSSRTAAALSFTTHRRTASDPCSIDDPTNYRSVYSIDVRGHFGRRS